MRYRRARWFASAGLLSLMLAVPAAVHAAQALQIALSTSATTPFMDDHVTLTGTTSPVVYGLQVTLLDADQTWVPIPGNQTDPNGAVTFAFIASQRGVYPGVHHFTIHFAGDGTYAAATSNEVTVELVQHPVSMTLHAGTFSGDGPINTDDRGYLRPRITADQCIGSIDVTELVNGGWNVVGGNNVFQNPDGGDPTACGVNINFGYRAVGSYHFRVDYQGYPINENLEQEIDVAVTLISTQTTLSATPNPVEAGSSTRLTATVSTQKGAGFVEGSGSFNFYDGAALIGTAAPSPGSGSAFIDVVYPITGTHSLTATWSGNTIADPSTSPTIGLTVVTNLAHATGLGLSLTAFYPVVDTFRDTVAVIGTLQERASVAITITNATTGATVRTLSVAMRDPGSYSVDWNGRTSAGILVAAGYYDVKQVVTDVLGAKLTVTTRVWASSRKLVWYSGSKTLYANQYAAKGSAGGATIATTTKYYRGMKLTMGLGTPGRWAGLGYQFTLPTATAYSGLAFYVLGSGTHSAKIGMHDRRLGTWPSGGTWIIDYFSPLVTVPTAYQWTHVWGSPTYSRSGTTVQGLILAQNWSSGTYYISKVKLAYKYALLK